MARRLLELGVVVLCALLVCHAQIIPGDTTAVRDSSAAGLHVISADTLAEDTLGVPVPSKSTGMAMLFSAILPGAGQVYNESYWKAPIVLGLGIYFAAEIIRNDRFADDYRQLYLQTGDTRYYNRREDYKSLRDTNAWYFLIVYVLNIVDAYVDASLFGFDVSPALALRGFGPNAGLSLRVTW